MGKQNRLIAKLKRRSMKTSAVMSMESKSNNELAALIKTTRDAFLRTPEWKALRKKAIETYGAKCMKCGHAPTDLRRINIDHIKPRKLFPDLSLVFDNLQVLCSSCNKDKGNKNQIDYR